MKPRFSGAGAEAVGAEGGGRAEGGGEAEYSGCLGDCGSVTGKAVMLAVAGGGGEGHGDGDFRAWGGMGGWGVPGLELPVEALPGGTMGV